MRTLKEQSKYGKTGTQDIGRRQTKQKHTTFCRQTQIQIRHEPSYKQLEVNHILRHLRFDLNVMLNIPTTCKMY